MVIDNNINYFYCKFCETRTIIDDIRYLSTCRSGYRFCSEACFTAYRLFYNNLFFEEMIKWHTHYYYDGKVICYYYSNISTEGCRHERK